MQETLRGAVEQGTERMISNSNYDIAGETGTARVDYIGNEMVKECNIVLHLQVHSPAEIQSILVSYLCTSQIRQRVLWRQRTALSFENAHWVYQKLPQPSPRDLVKRRTR